MDDFTSAYLKRISELEEERKSTVFSAPIPLPTYSSSVRLPQRKGEPNTKNEKAPSVSSFKNDLVSKTSEKRVPDLENRLKIAADNANYQADKLEHERSMSMAPVWNAQSLTGSYIPTAEQEQEVEDARAKGAELQSRIDALRRQANEYRAASQAEGYKSVINSSDFSTYSSRPESQRDTAIKKMSNGKADERYLVGLEHANGVGSMEWIQRTEQLTDQELGIYNYLRNKEGQESADKFLDYMEETLNQRLGGKQAENISNIENPVGKFLATGGYGFISGVDQFGSGVRQLFSEKALPTSAIQFGAAQVREDLADAGPKLGSRSLGQAAFEGTQMIGNMLPSIAIGSMAGGAGISANVAKALGSGVMSASAGGNAYNEAVKQGYTPEQARSYGTLVALSEGGLQYLLGGISALGGRVSGSVISKTVQNIDNALLRAGAELGLNMLSEGSEEYLQEVLTPVFRNIALDENNPVELVSEEAIYSGIMGALSAGLFEGPSRVTDAVSDVRTNQELRSIDRSYADMQENGIFGQGPRLLPTAGSVGREGTTTAGAWYDRNVGSAVDTQAPKNASTIETVTHRMTMEDFTNVNSPVWNNVEYGDTETQSRITRQTHQAMVEEGAVVTVPDSTREQVGQSYPDLRGMKKAERTPILRQKMKELKASLRQFLNGLKGGSYEFNVNGNILEAKLYDTGVREVLEKIDQSKASMLYHSDQVFQNARYLYSTPDYDGDPNVYRWNYFYTPVQIGGEIFGVRIAVRDMVRQTDGSMDSQIYNWGIKTGAALDGGERGNMPDRSDVSSATPDGAALDGGGRGQTRISSDVSSAAPDGMTLGTSASLVNPSRSSIPQSGGENNINTEQSGPRTRPTASDAGPDSSVGAASYGFDPYTNLVNQYGAIEPGERPARVVDAPKKISDTEEVSQAVRTVLEAKATPDSMIADIQQFILEGKANKIPVTNKELSANAENAIKKDGFDTVLRDWISKAASGDVSAQSMATGATLYNAALNAGDAKAAMDILFHYIQMSSESGKALQANRILKTLTPSGQLYMLQKTVSKIDESVNGQNKQSGTGGEVFDSLNKQENSDAIDAIKDSRDTAVKLIQDIIEAFRDNPDSISDIAGEKDATWVEQLGRELAKNASNRARPQKTEQTIYKTILSDLNAFMSEHVNKGKLSAPKRTAAERIADFFNNREEYARAWDSAQRRLREEYAGDQDMLNKLDEFLDSTIAYNAVGPDTVMLRAVADAALENDVSLKDYVIKGKYDEDALVSQISSTLIEETGATGSDKTVITDAVRRFVVEKYLDASKNAEYYISSDIRKKMKDFGVKLSEIIYEGASTKEALAQKISSALVTDYKISKTSADGISSDIVDRFNSMVSDASRKRLEQMFKDKPERVKRTLYEEFERLANLGAFSSPNFNELATSKLFKTDRISIRDDLAEKFLNAETDADRDAVIDEIYKDIARKIPSSFSEKFTALRYLNMLGNFKTIFRNYGGNAIMYGVRSGRVKLESALQNAVYALSKGRTDRTTTFFRDKGLYKEALRDFESVKAEASGEQKYSVYSKRLPTAIQNYRTIFKNNGTWGTEPDSNVVAKGLRKASDVALSGFEAARKATSWAMETGDVVFLKRVYADAMARYLKAKGVTAEQFAGGTVDQSLLDEARAYSIKEAQEATFRDKNQFSDMISEIGFRDDSTAAKRFANAEIHGTLPFRRTPANVLVRGIEYSPVGLLDTAVKSVKAAKKTTDADGNVQVTGTDVINSLSKALTGTGLFLLGRALFKRGLLTAGEDDDDKQNALDRMQGKQAYSLHIPGVGYYSFDWASPAAMPLFMGAELEKALEETGLNADAFKKAVAGSSNVLLNMSMLQGVNDQFETVKYSEYPLADIAINSLVKFLNQGLTSTLGGQIERAMEDVRMTTYTDKNLPIPTDFQYLLGKASAKTPGIDYQQIKYTDEFGEEESSGPLYLRAFENFISPGYISPEKESAVVDEAQRLYQEPDDGVVVPKRAEKSITVDKKTINLSAEQYDKYNRTRGQTANQILEALIALPSYQSMSDDQKRETFQSVYEYATDVAKMEVSDFKPDGKTAKILKSGVPADLYMVYSATADANDDDTVSQVESAAALLPIAGLTEEQKGKIWQSQNTAWGEKKNPFTGALPKAGIDPETSIGILQKYSEIDDAAYSGGSVARQKQTALSKYLDTLDLSEKERSVVDDTYVFFNMFPASVIPYNLDTMSDTAQEKWPRAERMGYSEEEYVKYYPICAAGGKKKTEIIQDLINAGMTRQEALQFWNIVK